MSLQTRLEALVAAIGTDIKALNTAQNAKAHLPMYPSLTDFQYKAQSMDPFSVSSGTVTLNGGGTIRLVRLKCGVAGYANNVHFAIRSAGSTFTSLNALALYNDSGEKLAETGSAVTAWSSTGLKTVAFTDPAYLSVNQYVYVATVNTSVSAPALMGITHDLFSGIIPGLGTSSTRPCYTHSSALHSTFPSTITLTSQTADRFIPWFALS